jgi:hypothetical protein
MNARQFIMRCTRAVFCTTIALLLISFSLFAQEGGETLRTIVGFEQSGASSAQSAQRFFTDFYVSVPFSMATLTCIPAYNKV